MTDPRDGLHPSEETHQAPVVTDLDPGDARRSSPIQPPAPLEVTDRNACSTRDVTEGRQSGGPEEENYDPRDAAEEDTARPMESLSEAAAATFSQATRSAKTIQGTSNTNHAMDELNRIAQDVRRLTHLSEEERQRQMSMIYSRRKRLRAKKRVEELDQQCVEFKQANDTLRIENARLEAILTSVMQQILSTTNATGGSSAAGTMEPNHPYNSSLPSPANALNMPAAVGALTNSTEYAQNSWMPPQLAQPSAPPPPAMLEAAHPGLLLSSLIGQALMEESGIPSGPHMQHPTAASSMSSSGNAASALHQQQQQQHQTVLPLPMTTSQRNSIEHSLIWQQILQQQQQQALALAAAGGGCSVTWPQPQATPLSLGSTTATSLGLESTRMLQKLQDSSSQWQNLSLQHQQQQLQMPHAPMVTETDAQDHSQQTHASMWLELLHKQQQ